MSRTLLAMALVMGVTVSMPGRVEAEARYAIVELGTLGGAGSWPGRLSDSQPVQIAGSSMTSGSSLLHAFLWTAGGTAMTGDMENLGEGASGCAGSGGAGINNNGDVVGRFTGSSCSDGPFLWSPTNGGEFTPLGSLPDHDTYDEWALDINEADVILGEVSFEEPQAALVTHAVRWGAGSTTPVDLHSANLPTRGSTFPSEINAGGTAAGTSCSLSGDCRAVYWPPSGDAVLLDSRANDGSTDYAGSRGGGINDAGDVVGSWGVRQEDNTEFTRASLWPSNGPRVSLGLLPGDDCVSRATAINNSDQVVGVSIGRDDEDDCLEQHGFLWENGEMLALNDLVPGDKEIIPVDINERGEILGMTGGSGVYQVVLLTFGGQSPVLFETFALDAPPVTEGGGGGAATLAAVGPMPKPTAKFVVKRDEGSGTSKVKYATQNDTAKAGQDYVAKSGTLTFTGNQKSKTVKVTILNNNRKEPNEKFFLTLSKPSDNAKITDRKAKATIRDDD